MSDSATVRARLSNHCQLPRRRIIHLPACNVVLHVVVVPRLVGIIVGVEPIVSACSQLGLKVDAVKQLLWVDMPPNPSLSHRPCSGRR